MFLRVYHIFRAIKYVSLWGSPKSQAICDIFKCKSNEKFIFKCLIKESSYKVLLFLLVLSTFCFGYTIRIFERTYEAKNGRSNMNMDNIWNCM